MSMKIAIIIERADTALGGAERSVLELAAALTGLGLVVDILAAKGQVDGGKVRVLCPRTPGKRVSYFVFEKALKTHLVENSYDIVHSVLPFRFADVYQPRGGTYAESIVRNGASYQNSFVKSYKRLTAFTNTRRSILLRAERKLARQAEGPVIVAISPYVAEQFRRHYDTDSRRIVLIPNGVRTDEPVDQEKGPVCLDYRLRNRERARGGLGFTGTPRGQERIESLITGVSERVETEAEP